MESRRDADHFAVLGIEPTTDRTHIRQAVLDQRRKWIRRQNAPNRARQREAEDRLTAIAAAETALMESRPVRNSLERVADATTPSPEPSPPPPIPSVQERRQHSRPGSTGAPGPGAGIDWVSRARAELARGDVRAARYSLAAAINAHPDSPAVWELKSALSRRQGLSGRAAYEMETAARLEPTPQLYLKLAELRESLGEFDRALGALNHAITLAPANPQCCIALAHFWRRRQRPDYAIAILERFMARYPTTPVVADAVGEVILARLDQHLTVMDDGTVAFTSLRQVQLGQLEMARGLSLPIRDAALLTRLKERSNACLRAKENTWQLPGNGPLGNAVVAVCWTVSILIAFILPTIFRQTTDATSVFAGLVCGGVVVSVFLATCRRPQWECDRQMYRHRVRRWGI